MALIKIEQPNPTPKEWRNSELQRTDELVLIPNYRYKQDLLRYRKELLDWPDSADYPDNKPTPPRTNLDGLNVLTVDINLQTRTKVQVNVPVTINATIKGADGAAVPITDSFAVPIKEIGGSIARTVGLDFIDGVAAKDITWSQSGEYEMTEALLNLHNDGVNWFKTERLVFSVYE